METATEYGRDFYAWLMRNAKLLRERKFSEVDIEHVAEELESVGKSERRELTNRLTVLLTHLLKWRFQPVRRSTSWKNTITTQRIDIKDLLVDSPSLKAALGDRIGLAYEKAKLAAEDETGLKKENFPEICPFSSDELLDMDFFPKNGNSD